MRKKSFSYEFSKILPLYAAAVEMHSKLPMPSPEYATFNTKNVANFITLLYVLTLFVKVKKNHG